MRCRMIIRQEREAEFPGIYKLVKTAFETAAVKDGDEQEYVGFLRKSENYIPELALVAEKDAVLIGHIMLTKIAVENSGGAFEELLLAPLCVALARRNQGVGAALVAESFRLARDMGYSAVFLCGDPAYYSRFGFRLTSDFGITPGNAIEQRYVLGCELTRGALRHKSGVITFSGI